MMNMIHNGGKHKNGQVEDLYSLMPEQEPQSDTEHLEEVMTPNSEMSTQKKARSNVYNEKENDLVCLACLATSVDPFHEQKHYTPYKNK